MKYAVRGHNYEDLSDKTEEFMHMEMAIVTHFLVDCFPDAKFILNIRDPYTWLNSEINQNIASFGAINF